MKHNLEPSGLELDIKPRARPVAYNLDPAVRNENNPHIPARTEPSPRDIALAEAKRDKLKVCVLVGLGVGLAASVFPISTGVANLLGLGAALLSWECVEIHR